MGVTYPTRAVGVWQNLKFDNLIGFETLVFAASGILCNTTKRKQNLKSHHMTPLTLPTKLNNHFEPGFIQCSDRCIQMRAYLIR